MDATTIEVTTKAAAATNNRRHRTAIHNKAGNTTDRGNAVDHGPWGSEMLTALSTLSVKRPVTPSRSSLRPGAWRIAPASPTSSGATVTMPNRQEPNHTRHARKVDAVDWTKATATAAPMAPTADPIALASKNPSTSGTFPSLNG